MAMIEEDEGLPDRIVMSDEALRQPARTSHKTCLRGFGVNGITGWMSAVLHVVLTSSVSKAKKQTSNYPLSNGGKIISLCYVLGKI
ncbi:hypothetical protein C0J52_01691 [Blattella germanica]|nr:hypothetical protein C0J52_01691 [Blattella germanica]